MPTENLASDASDSTPNPETEDLLNLTAETLIVVNEHKIETTLPLKIPE
jgi:hypothetical protein